jgi:hypothetical protein
MNIAVNELANALFKKPLQECSVEELQQLAQQYPYFGPAQLLLAKKLSLLSNGQNDNSLLYEDQLQKTSLYFQNRVWLHHLLNGGNNINTGTDHSDVIEKEFTVTNTEQQQPAEWIVNAYKEAEIISTPAIEETIEQTEVSVETAATSTEHIAQPLITENNEVQPFSENNNEEAIEKSETLVEIPATENEPVVQPLINENHEVQQISEQAKEESTEQTAVPFEMPSLKFEPLPANTGPVFEPYHTVDYFASQGIKFKEDEKPKDRFSEQLKSFTEWLKTMKRIAATEITASDSMGEKKVEQMAEYSNAEPHVITEAMAEVWEKQGNKANAEDIYRKLSLLDPSKSSYFASKIEDLKKTN